MKTLDIMAPKVLVCGIELDKQGKKTYIKFNMLC